MNYVKAISVCAAVALASGALFVMASPSYGRGSPILVTAVPPDDAVVRHVSYADLNLAAAEGQRTLNWRIDAAVSSLCNEATGGNDGSPAYKYSMMRCSSGAWSDARPQIARAVQRSQELALTGHTTILATALTISLPK